MTMDNPIRSDLADNAVKYPERYGSNIESDWVYEIDKKFINGNRKRSNYRPLDRPAVDFS
jgi:hypothetical protein